MVLRSIFYGNIYPTEDAVAGDRHFQKLNQNISDAVDVLETKLSKEQMDLVNDLQNLITNLNCYEVEAQFKYGFTLGALLMQEINMTTKIRRD